MHPAAQIEQDDVDGFVAEDVHGVRHLSGVDDAEAIAVAFRFLHHFANEVSVGRVVLDQRHDPRRGLGSYAIGAIGASEV